MAADVALAPAVGRKRARPRAALAARRVLVGVPREPRRGDRPRRRRGGRAARDLRRFHRAAFADRAVPRLRARAAGLECRRNLALPARHRRRRPRHALAPDLRRARLAVHRRRRDERLLRRSASRSACSRRWRARSVDVVDHARDGPDHGGAEPRARHPRRRDPRARASPTRSSRSRSSISRAMSGWCAPRRSANSPRITSPPRASPASGRSG